MKKITLENYKGDRYYPRIVQTVHEILERGDDVVTPVEVFIGMGFLLRKSFEDWRFGRVPYLEKVLQCNLSRISRILRILRMHAHDLDLRPSLTVYMKWGRGSRTRLRFSKTGEPKLEEAYALHFFRQKRKDYNARNPETYKTSPPRASRVGT